METDERGVRTRNPGGRFLAGVRVYALLAGYTS
jgi:hypothetical protein